MRTAALLAAVVLVASQHRAPGFSCPDEPAPAPSRPAPRPRPAEVPKAAPRAAPRDGFAAAAALLRGLVADVRSAAELERLRRSDQLDPDLRAAADRRLRALREPRPLFGAVVPVYPWAYLERRPLCCFCSDEEPNDVRALHDEATVVWVPPGGRRR